MRTQSVGFTTSIRLARWYCTLSSLFVCDSFLVHVPAPNRSVEVTIALNTLTLSYSVSTLLPLLLRQHMVGPSCLCHSRVNLLLHAIVGCNYTILVGEGRDILKSLTSNKDLAEGCHWYLALHASPASCSG